MISLITTIQLSKETGQKIRRTFNDCIQIFEEAAEKHLENAWPTIKLCSYQEISANTVDLDPTGISAKLREKSEQ